MKVAVVGSGRVSSALIEKYVEQGDEIVSGGAAGIDQCAARFAKEHGFLLTEFLPQYDRYGRAAPIKRNYEIVDYADHLVVFWDGRSKGTRSVIEYAKKKGKPCEIILCEEI